MQPSPMSSLRERRTTTRSARRHTVRAKWRRAATGDPRENEAVQGLEPLLRCIDRCLHEFCLFRPDAPETLALQRSRSGKVRTKHEQMVLDGAENLICLPPGAIRADDPENRVQLVHRAIRLDAEGVLGDPLSPEQ